MRAVFWFTWAITAVMSIIYVGCAFATFNKISKVSVDSSARPMKYGMLGSCFLGFVMVTLFCVVSGCVYCTRGPLFSHHPMGLSMRTEIGFGVIVSAALHMMFFMLLAGLALHSGDAWARDRFGTSGMTYNTFRAAYGFAYLLAITFVVFFLVIACSFTDIVMPHGMHHTGMMHMAPAMMHGATVMPTMPMAMAVAPETRMMASYPAVVHPSGYPPQGYPH